MPRKILLYCLGLMLAGMASNSGALAQTGASPGRFEGQFQEVKRAQMGPALGVDQRTVDKLLQIDQRYQSPLSQANREAMAEFQRLQQIMSQPAPSDQEVRTILANMRQKQREVEELKRRKADEEMALLTPVQQARYIFYLQSMMREARSIRQGPVGPGGPGRAAPMTPSGPREIPVYRPSQ